MNKARILYNKKLLFIGYLFAFFIIFEFVIGVNLLHAEMTYDEVTVKISVNVSKEYGNSYDNEIVIKPLDKSSPLPGVGANGDEAVIDVKDNKSGNFEISFSEPGEYGYKIYENKGDKSKVEYDAKVYHATVFVMDNDGKLDYVLAIKIEGVNSKPDKIQFVNIEEEVTTQKETTTKEKTTKEDTTEETEETTNEGGGEDEKGEHRNNPTTGDEFPMETVLLIMFVSCSLIFALVIIKLRLSRDEEEDMKDREEDTKEVDESSESVDSEESNDE